MTLTCWYHKGVELDEREECPRCIDVMESIAKTLPHIEVPA